MVDGGILAGDIVQFWAESALPGLLVLFLYLFTWEDPRRAEPAGFGPRTFWLLIMGGLLGLDGFLPLLRLGDIYLAVSLAGGIIPLFLSLRFLGRELGGGTMTLVLFAGAFAAECLAAFAVVYRLGQSPVLSGPWLLAALAAPPAALAGIGALLRPASSSWTTALYRLSGFLAICSIALFGTFLTTEALPGYGIVSTFPWYLATPALVGALCALVAPALFPRSAASAVPVSYAAVTFGVLIGADLLRQIPLYTPGTSALYVIGGAGPGDLLYLSGLIAIIPAYLVGRLMRRPVRETGIAPALGSPERTLRAGESSFYAGDYSGTARASVQAVAESLERSRRILADAPSPIAPPPGLTGWAGADQANLDRLAGAGPIDSREAARAYATAAALVGLDRRAASGRFAPFGRRAWAFLLDLAVLCAVAAPLWLFAAVATPGADRLTGTAPLMLVAETAFPVIGFLYFALDEALTGTTVGKRALGLVVRSPELRPPSLLSAMVRTVPRLLVLTVVGVIGPVALALLLGPPALSGVGPTGAQLLLGALEVLALAMELGLILGLTGLVSLAIILAGPERQRLGDLWARTWVLRAPAGMPPGPPSAG